MIKTTYPNLIKLFIYLFLIIAITGCAGTKTPPTVYVEQDSDITVEDSLISPLDSAVWGSDSSSIDGTELPRQSICFPESFSISNETAANLKKCIDELVAKQEFNTALLEMENFLFSQLSPGVNMILLAQYAQLLDSLGENDKAGILWSRIYSQKDILDSVISLSEAYLSESGMMESSDDETKNLVEELNRTYFEGSHYKDISQRALILLKKIKSPELRKEIKKIVGNAWKRDERQVSAHLKQIKSNYLTQRNQQHSIRTIDSLKVIYPTQKMSEFNSLRTWILEQGGGITAQKESDSKLASADKLISRGRYIAALPILKKISDPLLKHEAKKRIIEAGQQFCKEKRKKASEYFKNSRKQASDPEKVKWLTKASIELDSCLIYFPNIPISKKVEKNQELIRGKLEKIKDGR